MKQRAFFLLRTLFATCLSYSAARGVTLGCLFLLFAWCAFFYSTPARAEQFNRPPSRVVYGFHREFPPFSFEEKGKAVGFEVELLQAALRGKGVKLQMRPMRWASVSGALEHGSIQVASGMAKTKRRAIQFDFSQRATAPLVGRFYMRNNNRVVKNSQLKGKKVSVEKSSYYQRLAENFGGLNIKLFSTKNDAIKALYNGYVDAYLGADKTASYIMQTNGITDISPVGEPLKKIYLYFAINKDQPELVKKINEGMLQVWENGEYDKIYRKWFVPKLTKNELQHLLEAAQKALPTAYAPYSQEVEGAALLGKSGKLYVGCNIENGLSSLTAGAMEVAAYRAVALGETQFKAAIKINVQGTAIPPSADERRVLQEFGRSILVITEPEKGEYVSQMVTQLLPYPHDLSF